VRKTTRNTIRVPEVAFFRFLYNSKGDPNGSPQFLMTQEVETTQTTYERPGDSENPKIFISAEDNSDAVPSVIAITISLKKFNLRKPTIGTMNKTTTTVNLNWKI